MEKNKDGKLFVILGYIFAGIISPILFLISLIKIIREKEDINVIKKAVFMMIISIILMTAEVFGGYYFCNHYNILNKDSKVINKDIKKKDKEDNKSDDKKTDYTDRSKTVINFFNDNNDAEGHGRYSADVNTNGDISDGTVNTYHCYDESCSFFVSEKEEEYVLLNDPKFIIYNVKTGKEYKADNLEFAVNLKSYETYEVDGELVGIKYTTNDGDSYYDLKTQKVVYSTYDIGKEILKCIPEIKKRHLVSIATPKNSNDVSDVIVIDMDNNNKEIFRVSNSNAIITNDKVVYYSKGLAAACFYTEVLYDGNYAKIFTNDERSLSYFLDEDGTFIYKDGESVVTKDSNYKEVSRIRIEGLNGVFDRESSVADRNNKLYLVSNSNGMIIKEFLAKNENVD